MTGSKHNRRLPVTDVANAEGYLVTHLEALRHQRGNIWIFLGLATTIDYLAGLERGKRAGRAGYIAFIRNYFPKEYSDFEYDSAHRKPGTGILKKGVRSKRQITRKDLPEQMYYIFRCGLVHCFSLVPSPSEIDNGGRERSITLHSRVDAARDGRNHLDNFKLTPHVLDSAYFIDEDLLDDVIGVVRKLFADQKKHKNIAKMLKLQPFISPHSECV